jgi:hypothetical protein
MGRFVCVYWGNVATSAFGGEYGLRFGGLQISELFTLGFVSILTFWNIRRCYFSDFLITRIGEKTASESWGNGSLVVFFGLWNIKKSIRNCKRRRSILAL